MEGNNVLKEIISCSPELQGSLDSVDITNCKNNLRSGGAGEVQESGSNRSSFSNVGSVNGASVGSVVCTRSAPLAILTLFKAIFVM